MTGYEALVFIHILAAMVWVGGGFLTMALGIQTARSRDPERMLAYVRQGPIVAILTAPATLVLIAFGVWAALDVDLDFGTTWITIGLTVWVIGFLLGVGFHGPHSKRMKGAIEQDGADSPRAARLLRVELMVSAVELALLILAVWAMVAKPA